MRVLNWKSLTAGAVAFAAGLGYAAGRGEKMPAPEYVAGLLADLPAAAPKLEPHSPARTAIESGDLDAAREMLAFRPYHEAPLPQGFPRFTPVGVIEVKRYPAYRKAVGAAFWPLFRHISQRDIPMTAPVEMTKPDQSGDTAMAFLYQSTEVGELGPIDEIRVEQTEETVVASLGVRGPISETLAAKGRTILQAWLADQAAYRAAGDEPFRLFGYNSPMVPDRSKYWEVQILLRPVD